MSLLRGNNEFVLPGWSKREFGLHLPLLQNEKGQPISPDDVDRLYHVCGKVIRFLLLSEQDRVKELVTSKIRQAVQNKNWHTLEDPVAPEFRGSIVGLDIELAETESDVESDTDEEGDSNSKNSGSSAAVAMVEVEEDGSVDCDCPFLRSHAQMLHVSEFVVAQLEMEIQNFTVDEVGSMAEAWAGNGYMSVWGII